MATRQTGEQKVRVEAAAAIARAQAKGQQINAKAQVAKAKRLSKRPIARRA